MDRAEAKEKNLDIFHFPSAKVREEFAAGLLAASGRVSFPFEEECAHFLLICLAVSPRLDEGVIARSMKERKHE
jgi:hypothetical protein